MTKHSWRLILAVAPMAWLAGSLAAAAPRVVPEILIPGTNLATESLTSTADGTVIIGSMNNGVIFRAPPGAASAEPWIQRQPAGLVNVLGVYADEASNTLWACSFTDGPATAPPGPSALHAFDLVSGAPKGQWPMPTPGAECNDIAVARDGTAYATDTRNMEVVRLRKGGARLEVWAGNGDFGPSGDVLDGIAIVRDTVVVNTLRTSRLFSVPVGADGKAGPVVEVKLDKPLSKPDGQRSFGDNGLLIVETGDGGRLSLVTLEGPALASGKVKHLKVGLADDPAAVTVVGETAYVVGAQWDAARHPPKPFKAIAVHVGPR